MMREELKRERTMRLHEAADSRRAFTPPGVAGDHGDG